MGQNSVLHVIPFAHVTRLIIDYRQLDVSQREEVARVTGVEFALVPSFLAMTPKETLRTRPRQVSE